jgi:hypothetical protein
MQYRVLLLQRTTLESGKVDHFFPNEFHTTDNDIPPSFHHHDEHRRPAYTNILKNDARRKRKLTDLSKARRKSN